MALLRSFSRSTHKCTIQQPQKSEQSNSKREKQTEQKISKTGVPFSHRLNQQRPNQSNQSQARTPIPYGFSRSQAQRRLTRSSRSACRAIRSATFASRSDTCDCCCVSVCSETTQQAERERSQQDRCAIIQDTNIAAVIREAKQRSHQAALVLSQRSAALNFHHELQH